MQVELFPLSVQVSRIPSERCHPGACEPCVCVIYTMCARHGSAGR